MGAPRPISDREGVRKHPAFKGAPQSLWFLFYVFPLMSVSQFLKLLAIRAGDGDFPESRLSIVAQEYCGARTS